MVRIGLVLVAVVALAACSKSGDAGAAADVVADAPTLVPAAKPGAPGAPGAMAPVLPLLAYSYTDTLIAPARALPALMERQEHACQAAGAAQCQVVSATLNQGGTDDATGSLTLRADPAWLTAFRGRLPGEAQAAGGKIADHEVKTEDLTRQIVDTEAAIRARTALRDRLQTVIETRPGKLSDLLDAEKELARVQGELDATQSELAVMKTRTASALLTLDFRTPPVLVGPRTWSPITGALQESASLLAGTLAAMLTMVIVLGPWAVAGGLVWWLVVRPINRRNARRTAKPG